MCDRKNCCNDVDSDTSKTSDQPRKIWLKKSDFLVAVPQIPVVLVDLFVSDLILVKFNFSNWNSTSKNLIRMPVHSIE